jgi:hypothetical protein
MNKHKSSYVISNLSWTRPAIGPTIGRLGTDKGSLSKSTALRNLANGIWGRMMNKPKITRAGTSFRTAISRMSIVARYLRPSHARASTNIQISRWPPVICVSCWDHLVWIKPLDDTRSIYRDTIDIDAGSLTYFPTLSPPGEKTNSRHSMGELLYAAVAVAPAEPALHSIRRCARASSDGGTSSPSAFAVLRLITNSNFVGCSTGKSPGLAPLKIL